MVEQPNRPTQKKGTCYGVTIQPKKNSLYLVYRIGKKKVWHALHLKLTGDPETDEATRRMAEQARILQENQLMAGEWGLQDPALSRLSVEEYADRVSKDKDKTAHIRKALRYIRDYSKGTQMLAVNRTWVEGYRRFLLGRETINQTTAAHYYAAFVWVMKSAIEDRVILRNPADRVKGITEPEPIKVWLDDDELAALWATMPYDGPLGREIRRAFLFSALSCGLRISDLRKLTWGNIARVPRLSVVIQQRKTQGVAGIPLNDDAWSLIKDEKIHPKSELVFPLLSHSTTSATQYFREWCKHAKIDKKIGWHTARHTFAVRTLQNGTDIYTLSKLLAHKDIKTTLVYAKLTDPMKQEAIDRLPAIRKAGAS